ncbi:MAG: NfeD family protein, partial [Halobacteriaceae archaeon]
AVLILVIGGGTLFAYRNLDIYGGKGIARTSDSDDLLGREGVVIEPVSTTGGKVRLYDGGFDPEYSARTVDGEIEEGEEVIVIDPGGGSVLTVESMDGYDEIDRELNTDDSVSSESTTDSE